MHASKLYSLLFLLAAIGIQCVVSTPIPQDTGSTDSNSTTDTSNSTNPDGPVVSSTVLSYSADEGQASPTVDPSPSPTDDPSPSPTIDPSQPSTANSTEGANGTNTTGGGGMDPPYFVVYAIDNAPSPPPVANLTGFNVVNLAFLQANGTPTSYSQPAVWQAMSASARAELKTSYARAGIKLLVSVFGATEKPTTNGVDANTSASAVAQWVKTYDLDGVDVDYEDLEAMAAGTGEQWVIDFTKQLYSELGGNYLITHAPLAGWFSPTRADMPSGGYRTIHNAVGTMINWYNVQFYGSPTYYTTCDNLLNESGGTYIPQTSAFEINSAGQVPLEKIVIGKPATEADALSGHMNSTVLASCVEEATQNNWTTGIMFWKYSNSTTSGIMQQARGSAFPLSSNSSSSVTGLDGSDTTGLNNTDTTAMNGTDTTGTNSTVSASSDTGSDDDTE